MRAGAPAKIAGLGAPEVELSLVVREAETPEGALFAEGAPWRFAAAVAGEVLAGDCEGPEQVVEAVGGRAVRRARCQGAWPRAAGTRA